MTHEGAVLVAADRDRPEVDTDRDREGGDDGGQDVTADQLHQDRAGRGFADAAGDGPEAVREVVGRVGEVGRGLAADQPDQQLVDIAGGDDGAELRQQPAALVPDGRAGRRS